MVGKAGAGAVVAFNRTTMELKLKVAVDEESEGIPF